MSKTHYNSKEIAIINVGVIILIGIVSYFIATSGPGFRNAGLGAFGIIVLMPIITILGIGIYLLGRLFLGMYHFLFTILVAMANLFVSYQYHFGFW